MRLAPIGYLPLTTIAVPSTRTATAVWMVVASVRCRDPVTSTTGPSRRVGAGSLMRIAQSYSQSVPAQRVAPGGAVVPTSR
jgi:hypothetical protein